MIEEMVMSDLRQRMSNRMCLRNLAARTRQAYLSAVEDLAKHYRRSPELLSIEEIQGYLLHLIHDRKLAYGTVNK